MNGIVRIASGCLCLCLCLMQFGCVADVETLVTGQIKSGHACSYVAVTGGVRSEPIQISGSFEIPSTAHVGRLEIFCDGVVVETINMDHSIDVGILPH